MPTTFTPFYQPRVYFLNSNTFPNDSFVIVLVDLYVSNWTPSQNGASLGNLIQRASDGVNLNIPYGEILASCPSGGGLQTFCLEVYKYTSMPTTFPTVTFTPSNLPPSTGTTKQVKSKGLTEFLCRPFMFQSLTNLQQFFIGALVDIDSNLNLASNWKTSYPPNSTTNGTGMLDTNISGSNSPNPTLDTYASPMFPACINQLSTVQITGVSGLSGTFAYTCPPCIQL